ncbi:hypothetical protein V497_08505, partial [Pseudogymnoascus sp. VKM F-4516 (FW-969)]
MFFTAQYVWCGTVTVPSTLPKAESAEKKERAATQPAQPREGRRLTKGRLMPYASGAQPAKCSRARKKAANPPIPKPLSLRKKTLLSALPLGRSAYPLFPVVTTPGAKWGGSGDFHDNQHTPHATPGGLAEGSRGMANRCAVLQYLDRRFKGSWVPATAAS